MCKGKASRELICHTCYLSTGPPFMYLSKSISLKATKMNTDLYDYPMIAFPCTEKNALIIGGKCQTVKELWSGRAGSNGRGY